PIPPAATRQVARGYAVASIDYRLTGAAIWPAQIHDCKAAIRFLRANAATWSLDPDRIGAMGSSAGGHLVAALAAMGDVAAVASGGYVVDLEGTVGPHAGTSSRVQCAVDQFGPANMLLANDLPTFDHDSANSPESRLVGGPLQANPEKWATVDPISFLSPDDPPLLAMHGTDDTSVPFHQSQLLVAAARAIGLDATLFAVQDNGHGGPGFLAPDATAAMDTFLDRALGALPAVRVGIAASDGQASENGDPAAFAVTRSGSTASPLVVGLWLAGDVTANADAAPFPLAVTIPAGQQGVTVPLVPQDDALVEGDESIAVHVVPAPAYRIDAAASRATAVLLDDDPAAGLPVVALEQFDAAATEAPGDPGAIRVVRTGSTATPLTVLCEFAGTATNGSDVTALPGSVTIPAGSSAALVVVAPLQDTLREPGETVVLRLVPAAHYARGAVRTGHVVITDDDRVVPPPVVGVLGTDPVLGEPAAPGAFTLTRTGATTQPLVVAFALTGRATNGGDYGLIAGSATIPAGAMWVRLPVAVADDGALEGSENVKLVIAANPSYRIGAAARAELRIADDEAVPPAPGPAQLVLGPLAVGAAGTATLLGGLANGVASLWIGLAPAFVPLPPFGTVGIDPLLAGPFLDLALASDGAGTATVLVPPVPSLAGIPTWWQAIATIPAAPFLALTNVAERTLLGSAAF
ncbi:MAG: prolyl oligopeptidase family serine peptidase, partial [Planctomycetota bacterium]